MTPPSYAWAALALVAAGAQMLRNAAQHDLTRRIGTAGATFVRFLYGLPFALVFLVLICLATGEPPPLPDARALMALALAAAAQVFATALMLRAMREKSFVVATALTKTEAMQIVLFGLLLQGGAPSVSLIVAAACATVGVLILSWSTIGLYPPRDGRSTVRAVAYGLSSAAPFAVATVSFRDAILALEGVSFLVAAGETLALGLILQTLAILGWLLGADRATLFALARGGRARRFRDSVLVSRLRARLGGARAHARPRRGALRATRRASLVCGAHDDAGRGERGAHSLWRRAGAQRLNGAFPKERRGFWHIKSME